MIHLTDKWEEKRLPKFKAVVKLTTLEKTYKMTIKATYFDICMMSYGSDWVITWFNNKAPKFQWRKFAEINAEGIKFTEVIAEESMAEDVDFGLDRVHPRIVWTNTKPLACGTVTLFRMERFMIASIYFTSSYASNDIRHLVRDVIVRSIVESYNLGLEDNMIWAFDADPVRGSLLRLKKYFKPIK